MRLFFSHCSSDKSLVREIKKGMHDFLDIWLDEKELLPGEDLRVELDNSIKDSDMLILFLSKESVSSKWVKIEVDAALEKQKVLDRPFLIPVLLEKCDVPNEIKQKLQLKLSSQSERDVNSLTEELNEKLFHLVLKYQISRKDVESDGGSQGVIGSYGGFIRDNVRDTIAKYISIIDSNTELRPSVIIILVKKEAESMFGEANEREIMWSKQLDEGIQGDKDEKLAMIGALGSTMYDIQIKLSRKIIDYIKFIESNTDSLSPEESVYILKKFIASLQ